MHLILSNTYGFRFAVLLSLASCVATSADALAQQPNQADPSEAFQRMFKSFAENAGPLGPMFGKLAPEQIERLKSIEISIAEEKRFGQRVLEAYLEQLRNAKIASTRVGRDIQYLNDLCNAIKPSLKHAKRYRRIDLRIIETNATDAYSIPGGHLLITRGLLETCGSEAALVGVLAHELSHLDRGHQLTPLKQSKLAQQPLDFDDSMMWIGLVARPFRPEQESEADLDATGWMMALDYDARQLAKLLDRWHKREAQQMPWMQFIPGFVKSHPNPGKRAQEILAHARQLQVRFPKASYIGVDNWKKRIAKSKQALP